MSEHSTSTEKGKILVSGFDRFGHLKRPNASSEVALPALEQKYGNLVETLVLPTAREIASRQLTEVIEDIHPVAVVMFGISAGRKVRLERRAKNAQFNLLIPDNNGVRKVGRIEKTGPRQLPSTLPLNDIYTRLEAADIPVRFSRSAGSFICNEVMYNALHHTGALESHDPIPTGFIHLGNGLSDQLVEEAALLVVEGLIEHDSDLK